MSEATDRLRRALGERRPKVAMILGSGLGGLVGDLADKVRVPYAELPGFPTGGVSGHGGELFAGAFEGVPVIMLSGRAHYYETGDAAAMRPALETLAAAGIDTLVLTNAAGAVDQDMTPGSVMLINDHINFAGAHPLIGEKSDRRFVGLTETYDLTLRTILQHAAVRSGTPLFHGVYMWFSGPSFETPAEIRMARLMGATAVGMSTVPEAILARFLGMRVAAFSIITNLAAGITGAELSHQETKDMAPVGGARLAALLKEAIGEF